MGAGWAVCERRLYGSASASEPYLERPGVRPLENTPLQITPTDGYARTDNREPHVAFVSQGIRVVLGEQLFKAALAPSAKKTCLVGAELENWLRHAPWPSPDILPARLPARTHANPAIRGPPSDAKHAQISTIF